MNFKSNITIKNIQKRNELIAVIREFFKRKEVLEIETPIINATTTNEVFLDSISVVVNGKNRCLHTSPEYAMKKLLAQFQISMYQICKVFRDNEVGTKHNAEFTMLEWYRVGFSLEEFIDELIELLNSIFPNYQVKNIVYGEIFEKHFGFCPYQATLESLNAYILQKKIFDAPLNYKSEALDLLFSMFVEPSLVGNCFYFVKDYPLEQASLSRLKKNLNNIEVANRFELFVNGMELANGYEELTDVDMLIKRNEDEIIKRKQIGKECYPIDDGLVEAHKLGIPDMTGASIGIDRLLMLYLNEKDIAKVISFKL